MTQRFTLFNLLVEMGQWVLQVRWLLLVKRCHAELLMGESLVLAARWSVSIMRIVAECRFIQVS